jgi:hypothetical protein
MKAKRAKRKATRYDIVKKYAGTDERPTAEELQEAYGYLDYCNDCGEELTAFEPFIHGTLGNNHMFGCKSYQRIFGVMINFPAKLIKLVFVFLLIPFVIIYLGVKEFIKECK